MKYYQGNIDIDCIPKGQDYRELTKRVFKLKADNYTLEEIAKECNISVCKVKEILE